MDNRRVIRSALVIGAFTSMSRFLGMVRDLLTAGVFGTSLAMSAFVVAFRIPNLFRRLFGEGALSSAFVPVYMETRRNEGEATAWTLAARVLSLASVLLIALTALGCLAAGFLLTRADPGSQRAMILPLTQIMLPYMIFICLAALCAAILNSHRHFTIPALSPSLMNLTWIFSVLVICPLMGNTLEEKIYGLAWGVLLSGLIQFAMQLPVLRRYGFAFRFTLVWNDPRVWRVFTLMGPATLGLAVTQINTMVNSLLAAWIGPWAPAALFYSERLLYFPQGILATAMSTVLLPVFAGCAAEKRLDDLLRTMNHSLRLLSFVMIPASIGLFVLARPIVQMLFEWGNFSAQSTDLTTIALQCYAPGLLVFSLSKVFVPAFYAHQDTRTPVKVGIACVLLNLFLNILFILTLPTYLKHAGLAAATVIAEAFNGFTLAWLVHRRFGSPGWRPMIHSAGKALLASLVMGGFILLALPATMDLVGRWIPVEKITQVVAVLVVIAGAMVIYLFAARLLRCPECGEALDAMRRRRKP
ncbi:MAG TPA: murein biosynthesis integral membrane protein MurJ [Kiritimatiellia bacterium]|nr:murein biosynthesis integral membrane protein MurJ [Kiritimatiellia bacterium]HMP34977.1 murein biosynthesis integral membrane protein MurJ [Kiritimatiellia bacterium]